ncbi:hypothetical protein [Dyella sp. 2RAB6]|uniref:hypothetical protein n=1 Tax=Dyella sp. 2RAB6 TaxID=3232992 RepID=UPI003F93A09A
MKTLLIALAIAAGLAHAAPAAAVGRLLDLSVYDRDTQRSLPVYQHQGRYYVAGQPGHRYRVTLRSRSGDDLLAVLSVDGVNAVSGQTAGWSQAGYVLDPRANTDVLGWRKSLSQVADFVFTDIGQSYAAKTGRPDNVGVIGVAVFRRKPLPPPVYEPAYEADRAMNQAAAPAASGELQRAAKASAPLGTGHGERENSAVTEVEFERASSSPDEVVTLYYDTWNNLAAQCVIPCERPRPVRPDPFPGRFVPDP